MAAMAVQHNMQSINANRLLGITTSQQKKSTEKLSSGYRINRAGDDAAGLAISEKMRGQIRGLNKASTNASDGISLIQTAEGGLNETHSILQRMRELAVQASTDTNTTDDRQQIQNELDELTKEVDRIATTTEFNTKKLLDGSCKGDVESKRGTGSVDGTFANSLVKVNMKTSQAKQLELGSDTYVFRIEVGYTSQSKFSAGTTVLNTNSAAKTYLNVSNLSSGSITVDKKAFYKLDSPTGDITSAAAAADLTISIANANKLKAGDVITITIGQAQCKQGLKTGNEPMRLQVGANAGQEINLGINSMRAQDLDIADITTGKALEVTTQAKASVAIEAYDEAIKKVSTERAKLGATQNRLEHTIDNLDSAAENTQSAESGIRDTDMASEMVTHSKNNILAQAGQSMLAQANQSTQGVLSLLG